MRLRIAATAKVAALLPLLTCLALLSVPRVGADAACSTNSLQCQLREGRINCSGSITGDAAAQLVNFTQPNPSVQPSFMSLSLPSALENMTAFSVTNLKGLVACFPLASDATLRLVAGTAECSLMPGSLDAFEGMERLTLKLRFARGRIPAGLFSARLAGLQNLQLESPAVSEIEPGAFKELRLLRRLFISNLKLARLTDTILQGLGELRVLELPDNALMRLDAASFAASPRLEYIDLRTRSAASVAVAADTFCALTVLQQLQYPASVSVNCSNFASRQLHLMLSRGPETETISCVRMLGETAPCARTAAGRLVTTTTTVAVTSAKSTTTPVRKETTPVASTTTTAAASTPTSSTKTTTASTSSVAAASTRTTPRSRPDKQATTASSAGPAIAVAVVAIALVLLAASVAIFFFTRRRRGVLRRAQSRQPIFSAGGGGGGVGIDLQDSLWNPTFENSTEGVDATTATAASAVRVLPDYEE